MTEKLTKRIVDSATYKGDGTSKHILWDSALTGLGLRVYPSGKKSFVLSYRQNNRKRLFVLGKYGILTVDQAREVAIEKMAEINRGEDPVEERRQLNKAQTFAELCEIYLERHAKVHKKSWKQDEGRINNYLLPAWGNHRITSISRSDIASLHSKIGVTRPYEANRILALLSKMFELAIEWGILEEMRFNPAQRIKKFKEAKRDRYVKIDEMPKLMQALQKEENTYARYAILMFLLTGMRKSELLNSKWEDVDFKRKEIRLADTKAGRTHYVPLSELAIQILKEIPRTLGNPYIFVGSKEGSALVNIRKPWLRISKEAGLEDVRVHDLRRTVGSWLAQEGHSLHLIGKILNHSNESTTKVYARLQENNAKDAMEEHGKLMGKFV